jgi:restriction system protein
MQGPYNSTTTKTNHNGLFLPYQILNDKGGALPSREFIAQTHARIQLTDWEQERYEKTGYVRWESILHFYTIDCIKAGFLQKEKGLWIITPEGEAALKLGPEGLLNAAKKGYRL